MAFFEQAQQRHLVCQIGETWFLITLWGRPAGEKQGGFRVFFSSGQPFVEQSFRFLFYNVNIWCKWQPAQQEQLWFTELWERRTSVTHSNQINFGAQHRNRSSQTDFQTKISSFHRLTLSSEQPEQSESMTSPQRNPKDLKTMITDTKQVQWR